MRKEAYAGKFYPSDADELKKTIKKLAENLKIERIKKKIIAGISPHAGYIYSGKAAAEVYYAISESWKKEKARPELFIILGTNHTGYATSDFSLSMEDFETPLGIAKNDCQFGKKLLELASKEEIGLKKDENAHLAEHSIEVQIPFLQYFFKNFKILPILINNYSPDSCGELASLLFDAIKKSKKNAMIIASSDFTHFGYMYGFMPFTADIKKQLYALDNKAINAICNLDVLAFMKISSKTTICGAGPISVAIEFARKYSSEVAVLDYYTSADIAKEEGYKNAVGYAAIVFF
ncbi:AmmeMemoRadiSam system protein B [Candidatus Pacearchaeota archaeon CG06_land_8_20_14_3_00_35_12]|nr:MAG: AmmeMemoRadiSam system protein B [Candidatus Pacearchaeota archaeon CG06_land_8_20_14_3_00_35_12]